MDIYVLSTFVFTLGVIFAQLFAKLKIVDEGVWNLTAMTDTSTTIEVSEHGLQAFSIWSAYHIVILIVLGVRRVVLWCQKLKRAKKSVWAELRNSVPTACRNLLDWMHRSREACKRMLNYWWTSDYWALGCKWGTEQGEDYADGRRSGRRSGRCGSGGANRQSASLSSTRSNVSVNLGA